MPILDTVVLFAAADPTDRYHDDAARHLRSAGTEAIVAASGLIEFDLVLRARGKTPAARRAEFKRLVAEFPEAETALGRVRPKTMYVATSLEEAFQLGYFDSLIAAEALALDGKIVSSDRDFDAVPGLERIALKGGH